MDADPNLLRVAAHAAAAQLLQLLAEPEVVRRCVSPGLVAAILGTGVSCTLGLEEAYRQYCMRLAANGSIMLVFYVLPSLRAAGAALGLGTP